MSRRKTECVDCKCDVNTRKARVIRVGKTARAIPSVLLSVVVAFFPKCPGCWAVYMSMFGSIGLANLPYMSWLLPVLMCFMAIHLYMLYKKARYNTYLPFLLSLAGALIIISGRVFFPLEKWMSITGMICIISGSLINSFSSNYVPMKFIRQ